MESMAGWEVIMTTAGVVLGLFGLVVIAVHTVMWMRGDDEEEEA